MKKKTILLGGAGVLAAAAAAFFLIRKKKRAEAGDKPPKNAPQLKIDNPGTQSDFPVAPSESEMG